MNIKNLKNEIYNQKVKHNNHEKLKNDNSKLIEEIENFKNKDEEMKILHDEIEK
jgi:hypothetical protein